MRASLSIFAQPMVQSLFSIMNSIVDSHSDRTEIDTCSAIVTVKYQLNSAGVTASGKFHRKDIQENRVNGNLQASFSQYKERLFTKQEAMLKRQRKLTAKKNPKIKGSKKRNKVHEKVT